MKIIYSSEKKKILEKLESQYGIKKLPFLLIRFGKEKIRLYSGNLATEELAALDKNLKIENAGLYFAKEQKDGIRLTMDALSILKSQITKNILDLDDEQAEKWMKGYDLDIKKEKGFKILRHERELIGCGKSTGEKITNFTPKERRIKS
jgi:NOL1/NOP2/fmu family ribosome biogenesis protein